MTGSPNPPNQVENDIYILVDSHLSPLLNRLPQALRSQPAGHVEGRIRSPALVDREHAGGARFEPAQALHQEGTVRPSEPGQAVLGVGGGEDEVSWGSFVRVFARQVEVLATGEGTRRK